MLLFTYCHLPERVNGYAPFSPSLIEKHDRMLRFFICFAYLCSAKGILWVCFVIPFVMRFVGVAFVYFMACVISLGCRRREA